MGSGISLSKQNIVDIISREIDMIKNNTTIEFNEKQANISIYSEDGCIIYQDFTDEKNYKQKIKDLNNKLDEIIRISKK
jgi:hypothetical protein